LSNKTIKNFEATMEKDSASMTKAHEQMSKAVAIAARKVEKKEKEETGAEKYRRISAEKEEKKIKSVKRAARGLIKKKKIKKMTAYFGQS
jgi:hypothetical protein